MDQKKRREVVVSELFEEDVQSIYLYGEQVFGATLAKEFILDMYEKVWNLSTEWESYPECRYLPTKNRRYRNLIFHTYLIIYKIDPDSIQVLRVLHGRSSIKKIKSSRKRAD